MAIAGSGGRRPTRGDVAEGIHAIEVTDVLQQEDLVIRVVRQRVARARVGLGGGGDAEVGPPVERRVIDPCVPKRFVPTAHKERDPVDCVEREVGG